MGEHQHRPEARPFVAACFASLLLFALVAPMGTTAAATTTLVMAESGSGGAWIAVKVNVPEPGRFRFAFSESFGSEAATPEVQGNSLRTTPAHPSVLHFGFKTDAGTITGLTTVMHDPSQIMINTPDDGAQVEIPHWTATGYSGTILKGWPTTGTFWAYAFAGSEGGLESYSIRLTSTVPVEVLEVLRGSGVAAVDETSFRSSEGAAVAVQPGPANPSIVTGAAWTHESASGMLGFVLQSGTGQTSWAVNGPQGSVDAWQHAATPVSGLASAVAPGSEGNSWHYLPHQTGAGAYGFAISDRADTNTLVVAVADIPELPL